VYLLKQIGQKAHVSPSENKATKIRMNDSKVRLSCTVQCTTSGYLLVTFRPTWNRKAVFWCKPFGRVHCFCFIIITETPTWSLSLALQLQPYNHRH